MRMTVVRADDTPLTIAERIGEAPARVGAIEIDAVVVTIAARLGCDAALLRETILRRPFGRRHDPIFLPCAEDARLFGSFEVDKFEVDRLEVGHVKYFSHGKSGYAHIVDYFPSSPIAPSDAKNAAGRPISEYVSHSAFRGTGMPVIRKAAVGSGSLHFDVERAKVAI